MELGRVCRRVRDLLMTTLCAGLAFYLVLADVRLSFISFRFFFSFIPFNFAFVSRPSLVIPSFFYGTLGRQKGKRVGNRDRVEVHTGQALTLNRTLMKKKKNRQHLTHYSVVDQRVPKNAVSLVRKFSDIRLTHFITSFLIA